MDKKQKLQDLYKKLEALQSKADLSMGDVANLTDSLIEEEIAQAKAKLKDSPTIKILRSFGEELKRFKTNFDLKPIMDSITSLSQGIDKSNQAIVDEFEKRLKSVRTTDLSGLEREIASIKAEFADKVTTDSARGEFDNAKLEKELSDIAKKFGDLTSRLDALSQEDKVSGPLGESEKRQQESNKSLTEAQRKELEKKIEELRKDLMARIGNIGGGGMNRQIFVGGNNPLTKYNDINIKAGSNVTITTAVNNTTKKVDITIASSGGGGGGTVRSVNSISTSTAADSASGTDYVYLCTGTLTLTLPDASANTNLYTVKNVGTGIVTIDTTSSQTIDGALTIIMPLRYTAVDLISDTANWNVT